MIKISDSSHLNGKSLNDIAEEYWILLKAELQPGYVGRNQKITVDNRTYEKSNSIIAKFHAVLNENWENAELKKYLEALKENDFQRLKNIICDGPSELRSRIEEFKKLNISAPLFKSRNNSKRPLKQISEWEVLAKIFDYKHYQKKVSHWLGEKLGIKVCPYCNTQYTLLVESTGSKLGKTAKYQLDHF